MKQGKRPTFEQKLLLVRNEYDPEDWLCVQRKDTREGTHYTFVHRVTGEHLVLYD